MSFSTTLSQETNANSRQVAQRYLIPKTAGNWGKCLRLRLGVYSASVALVLQRHKAEAYYLLNASSSGL